MKINDNTELTKYREVADAYTATNRQITGVNKPDIKSLSVGKASDLIALCGKSLQDIKDTAQNVDIKSMQDYMTVLSNTMSKEDYSRMMKDGFDPADMTGEEVITILDHIKAVLVVSGQIIEGYNDDLDKELLVNITGSVATAQAIFDAMKQADIPINEDNVNEINKAIDRLSQVRELNDDAKRYMIENHMSPTIDNIYKASFSAASSENKSGYYQLDMPGYLAKKSEAGSKDLLSDISLAIDRFGIDGIDYSMQLDAARWLVDKDLDVTANNIVALCNLDSISFPVDDSYAYQAIVNALKEGSYAYDANLSMGYEDIYTKALRILDETNHIEAEAISLLEEGKEVNIKNLFEVQTIGIEKEAEALSLRRTLEQIRLKMTLDINVSLLRRGMAIDTMPLSELVESIEAEQSRLHSMYLGSGDTEELARKASLFDRTCKVASDIPNLPAAVIGRLKLEQQYSLSVVHETGTMLKARYESAGQSYEALMTAPRKDLGDSYAKAFSNVDDILADLGMEAVEENRKAIRILGYNSMDIDATSVNRVKREVNRVMQVVYDLTPARTLELIRQNINPLDMNLDELADILGNMNKEDNDERYASFLYRLERNEEISQDERDSFVGIYRLMNRLERTDDASIGALIAQDRDITFRNLLTAMRSSKMRIDQRVDEDFGLLDSVIQKGISISDQIESAYTGKYGDDTYSYYNEKYSEYMQSLESDASIADVLEELDIPCTISNIVAYSGLIDSTKNVFKRLAQYEELSDETANTSEIIDSFDKAIENLEDCESAQVGYEQALSDIYRYVDQIKYKDNIGYLDIKAMIACTKQLALASRMSKSEEYVIPMQLEKKLTTIRLTLKHESAQKGRVDIRFVHDEYKEVTAHMILDRSIVHGLAVCETKEGANKMEQAIASLSYKCDVKVVIGKESKDSVYESFQNADIDNIDTKQLYSLAREFLSKITD